MDMDEVRIVGSIQFLVVALVAGWAFDSLRHKEALRLRAEAERVEAERLLAVEQETATRLQERTEMARQLHDSVLQTLKLISTSADDSGEVRFLARVQERYLLRTINEYRSPYRDSFRARLLDARAALEDRYRVEIEQVIRDDAEMNPGLHALVDAAGEAMANAARHSGSASIDLYAEVTPAGVQVNVRDRGSGFDPEAVGTGGMVHSILDRMAEAGGTAEIKSTPGRGTDVELFLPTP
jgi:signal transduction histidine kinase